MRRITYVFLLVLLYPLLSKAQHSAVIKGTVGDSLTKERIIGATVYALDNITGGVVTDVQGNYTLHVPTGTHTIICSILGMNPDTSVITVTDTSAITHNFMLSSQSKQMQTLVVSAGRYQQRLQDITVSMDLLKPQMIENKNSTSIKQALDQAPGLDILDGEPQIRGGSGFDFGVGSRVALLIDGLPALPGDGGRIDWNLIPLENVSQIEIIKGASSVTYGASALSGSINIRTAYPTDTPSTSVAAYSGIYNSPPVAGAKWWNGAANFSGMSFLHSEKMGQLDLVLGGMILYDHGYIGPPQYMPQLSSTINGTPVSDNQMGEKTGRFNFSLRYRPKKIPRLNYGINGDAGQSTNVVSLIWSNDSSGLYRAYPSTVILQTQQMFYLDPFINYTTADGFEHSFRARYYYTNNVETNNPSNTTNVAYLEYQCIKKFYELGGLNFTAGTVMNDVYNHTDSVSYYGVPIAPTNNRVQNYAAYAQLDKRFWNILNVSAGFRDENFIVDNDKVVSKPIFRSGLNLRLSEGTFLRCSFGQGYRFPSLTEKYLESQFSILSIFPNPTLQPESSWNAEVGVKQGFKIAKFMGFLDAAAFWQQYQNTIELTYGSWGEYLQYGKVAYNNGFKYLNTGGTQVKGIDASIGGEGSLSNNVKLDLMGSYTYTLPQALDPNMVYATDTAKRQLSYASTSSNTTNNVLKYRMQHLAKLNIELKVKRYSVGADWIYYSFIQNIDEVFYTLASVASYGIAQYRDTHNKGINVFNAHVGEQVSKHTKIAFVVNNIFNLSYSLRPLKIEPPRTFAIRVTYKV